MAKNDGVVKIHGKSYKTVARRVADFRAIYKIGEGWGIVSEMVDGHGKDYAVFRAQIIDPKGRIVATGWGRDARTDSPRHKVSWVEIAETSAIGRAMSFVSAELMGDELQIASADEVVMAIESGRSSGQEQSGSLMAPRESSTTIEELDRAAQAIAGMDISEGDKSSLRKTYMRKRGELSNNG